MNANSLSRSHTGNLLSILFSRISHAGLITFKSGEIKWPFKLSFNYQADI